MRTLARACTRGEGCRLRRDSKVLHNSARWSASARRQTLEYKRVEFKARIVVGVCDNQLATARKLLIRKRRDVERSMRHAWKAISARLTKQHGNTSSLNQFNDLPL
jgi:hypothetical protein